MPYAGFKSAILSEMLGMKGSAIRISEGTLLL